MLTDAQVAALIPVPEIPRIPVGVVRRTKFPLDEFVNTGRDVSSREYEREISALLIPFPSSLPREVDWLDTVGSCPLISSDRIKTPVEAGETFLHSVRHLCFHLLTASRSTGSTGPAMMPPMSMIPSSLWVIVERGPAFCGG